VAALAANLDAMGYYPTTHAVFGAMADKDLAPMFARIMPLIDKWYFTDLPTPRAATAQALQAGLQAQGPRPQVSCATFAAPLVALQAAITAADPADRIIIFGSFFTVGGVLKEGVPRLQAQHLNA
jgi:dihydrofolate synthase/folylpolyglutamate synthase